MASFGKTSSYSAAWTSAASGKRSRLAKVSRLSITTLAKPASVATFERLLEMCPAPKMKVCGTGSTGCPKLVALIAHPAGGESVEAHASHSDAGSSAVPAGRSDIPPTMDLLLDVELPVSVSFGKTEIPMKDVLKLTTGSIVELNRGVNEPVEVLVNHCLIARGEVVVVEGNYG